jgi:DNA-binding beta-propeller fold protein YncE
MSIKVWASVALVTLMLTPDVPKASGLMTIEDKIPLGQVEGRIDHLAVDLARKRLFVAELGNNSVGVVDLTDRKVLHRISGFKEPQGVAYAQASDLLYVATAGDGFVRWLRGSDFAPAGELKLGADADNIRIDRRSNQVLVGYGSGALAVLDGTSGQKSADISLPAHPESFQLEMQGSRIYANVPDARHVAVIARASGREIAQWNLPGAAGNFPMALDESGNRLFVVYRNPAMLAIFDTVQASIAAQLPTCGDADDVFFDEKRRRIYISCGEGVLAVIQQDGSSYHEADRLATNSGARTALFVPELDRLFLAVRARGREPAAIWVLRPAS